MRWVGTGWTTGLLHTRTAEHKPRTVTVTVTGRSCCAYCQAKHAFEHLARYVHCILAEAADQFQSNSRVVTICTPFPASSRKFLLFTCLAAAVANLKAQAWHASAPQGMRLHVPMDAKGSTGSSGVVICSCCCHSVLALHGCRVRHPGRCSYDTDLKRDS